jgi:trimeric autotransporter adhesin
MAGDDSGATVGTITGYLRLDKSDWSAEILSAQGQAEALGKTNPNIRIDTNAPSAIVQLEAVAAAAKRLQDAQGKVSVAQAKVNDLEAAGNAPASKLTAAHENLAKATRDVELAQIRLASAYDGVAPKSEKALSDSEQFKKMLDGLDGSSEGAGLSFTEVLIPALAAAVTVLGPLLAVGIAGIGTLLLGITGLKDQVISGLTPAFTGLEKTASAALGPGVTDSVKELEQGLPKLAPLVQTFGADIGEQIQELTTYLNNGGFQKFTDYAEQELPIVQGLFDDAAKSAVEFFSAATPTGNALISSLSGVVTVLGVVSEYYAKINSQAAAGPQKSASGNALFAGALALQTVVAPTTSVINGLAGNGPGGSLFSKSVSGQGSQAPATEAATALAGSLHDVVDGLDAVASQTAATNQVAALAQQFSNANPAVQDLITELGTFGQSLDSSVDKAKLLGAVLVESQGDALSYAGAVASGYGADSALVQAFQAQAQALQQQNAANAANAADDASSSQTSATAKDKSAAASERLQAADDRLASVRKAGSKSTAAQILSAEAAVSSARASAATTATSTAKTEKASAADTATAFANTELGAINLKTGLINLSSQGAGPLIQQLQAMQSAAENAAEAVYEHEVNTKGDSVALSDAQKIFESMTGGSLVANAKQLGLTAAQAKLLADNYFAVPPNVSTLVQSVGLNNVNDTLDAIGQQLSYLTGKPFVIQVTADITGDFAANLAGQSLHDVVNAIVAPSKAPTAAPLSPKAGHRATGGALNEGLTWVGDGGMPELLNKSGPNVTVYSGARSKAKSASTATAQPIILHSYTVLDSKVVGKSVNEFNMRGDRR